MASHCFLIFIAAFSPNLSIELTVNASCCLSLLLYTGQQRLQVSFCKCLPRAVQILAIGFVPSTPIQPTAGFSMRLLAYHNYAWHNSNVRMGPFHKTQRQFNEERSQVLWNQRQTEVSQVYLSSQSGWPLTTRCQISQGRDLTTCLSACVTVYRELLERTSNLVQTVLQLSPAQKLASNTCPACFGPSLKTGSHQLLWVDNKLIIALDGNFQHRHHKAAGRNATPLSTPTMFIPPSDLDAMKDHIASQEKIHKVPKKVSRCFTPLIDSCLQFDLIISSPRATSVPTPTRQEMIPEMNPPGRVAMTPASWGHAADTIQLSFW